MRHPCTQCGASYRYPHDLDEHKRVGCRVESIKGETLIAEEVSEPEVNQEVSPEPEEEKESSQCQEPMST